MPGIGPPPKDPSKRARRNADVLPMRVVEAPPVEQPELPEFDIEVTIDGKVETQKFRWHTRTREWWRMWGESPLAKDFTDNDWNELLDTALIHSRFWNGEVKLAGELRLRVAKFGATPEDRARLRIQFASADHAENKSRVPTPAPGQRQRRKLTG